ncbi:efflux RND transporter permease subunit [Acidobacteria bacterium AH-259-G07]|nr:efflux RND transporter permease subunit [Acidobacteria bacterium AH-259-G07]
MMDTQHQTQDRGILSWFVHNKVAANLLMLLVLIGGVISMLRMRQEVFPDIETGLITVRVPYRGASPEEVEEGVVVRLEEAIAGIEGIKRIRSVAAEGEGTVMVELEDYVDERRVLNDIEAAVNRIETFPQEIEEPIISQASRRVQVISIALYGEVPERTLKELAERMRNELTAMRNISQVELSGVRRYEISIEVSEEALRRHGLTFEQVATVVRQSSLDLPGGSIETEAGEILLRTKGQRYSGRQFEDLILITHNDGTVLRMGDVGRVMDGFEDSDIAAFFDGKPAAVLKLFRVGEQDALDVAATVKRYLEEQRELLPYGVSTDFWFDRSRYLEERINLLVRNAYIGLFLVFLCLTMFLNPKLAFWTTMGIPISFMGAFWMLPQFDVTINMISVFGFIVVLGLVVDDAIVVGENIFTYRQQGMNATEAAVRGVREMAAPVTVAVLTTVVAFMPLLFTSGDIGKIISVIPLVVIAVLLVSLVEALLTLPAHLSDSPRGGASGPTMQGQSRVQTILDRFIHGPYMRTLRWAVHWRYATMAIAVALFAVTIGFVLGGHIKFVFFEAVDSDNLLAELTMPQGTPVERTRAVVERIQQAAMRVGQQLDAEGGTGTPSVFRHISTTIGQQPFKRLTSGPGGAVLATSLGNSHLAEVNIELVSSQHRDIAAARIENLWRQEVGEIAGISSLVFQSSFFSAGEAINLELSHPDFDTTLHVVEQIKEALRQYRGVSDIQDSFLPGKREIRLSLREEGRTLGLTLADLARQLRHAFYGAEAQRIQRGRDDIKVMVRYPESQRRSLADIETMRIRLPDGTEAVAQVSRGRGYAKIDRAERRRIVRVTADVDETLPGVSADGINADLGNVVLPQLQQQYPGLLFGFEGQQAERRESMQSLGVYSVVALLGIFALLGVLFRSYVQPLIVMSAIPFGLIGAVVGHLIMGLNLSFLSAFGVVALTGVVVNDSLIMIDLINRRRSQDEPLRQVIMECGMRRFRPILLTTLTTFFGLTPMLLETSLQARFLLPMAASLAFGVLFATAITLILVPTLYMILGDLRNLVARPAQERAEMIHPSAAGQ